MNKIFPSPWAAEIVDTVNRLRAGRPKNRGSIAARCKKFIFFPQRPDRPNYPFPEWGALEQPGREADYPPHLLPRFISGAVTPLPHMLSWSAQAHLHDF
jgi:hypothetical protein